MRRTYLISVLAIFVLVGCNASKHSNKHGIGDRSLIEFAKLMEGKFSSELQSKQDTSYFNISFVMSPIWTNRTDGIWLYVEQAVSTKLDKPYRQRVYHLQHPEENTFTSDIYTIKDAMQYAGLQNDKSKQDKLTFEQIELKEGCTVTLSKRNNIYEGGTDADKCPSELRGAKYATTKIILKEGELQSWDQGFDANGKQVWGATKGGYIFIKQ